MSCCAEGCPVVASGLLRFLLDEDHPPRVCDVAPEVQPVAGEWYLIATPDGERVAQLARFGGPVLASCTERIAGRAVRVASEAERERSEQLRHVERDALLYLRTRAEELSLPMRPVTALAPLDRDALLITFEADGRVDFRQLLRDLGRRTRRRVELRQVGARDQARAAGGWGPCGRALCCSDFMVRFASVTIRMAKAQGLSLSPNRISGMCGRLMCCLAHEAPQAPAAAAPRENKQ